MAPSQIRGPDLSGVVADANASGLKHVVIGGFAVIAHGYVRATKDSDLLVPDGFEADEAILRFFERIGAKRFSDGKALTAEDVAGAHHLRGLAAQSGRLQASGQSQHGPGRPRKVGAGQRRTSH